MPTDDPFELWNQDQNPPVEDEQRRPFELWGTAEGEDGKPVIVVFPSPIARQSAAIVGGQFLALRDACDPEGNPVFTREEAFKIVIESMSAVVVHHGDHDDDDD